MRARLLIDQPITPGTVDERIVVGEDGKSYWPAGAVLEDPRAQRLVQMGVAEPADAECTLAANMTSEQMAAAQRKQEMLAKGIVEDDYQRYFDGEMMGYDADGNDIPGPNWIDRDAPESDLILPEGFNE